MEDLNIVPQKNLKKIFGVKNEHRFFWAPWWYFVISHNNYKFLFYNRIWWADQVDFKKRSSFLRCSIIFKKAQRKENLENYEKSKKFDLRSITSLENKNKKS